MHVIFRYVGQFVVDHVGQLFDIEATGGNISGHKYTDLALFKVAKSPGACILGFVSVDRIGNQAVALELLADPVGSMLGTGKDQYLSPVVRANHVGEELQLATTVHRVDDLGHALSRRVLTCDLDQAGVVEQVFGESLDLL